MGRHRIKLYLLGALAALGIALGGWCAILGARPDRELVFVREAPSSVSPEILSQSVWSLGNWPHWFHSLEKAERVDLLGRAMAQRDQSVENGALIKLEIRPHRGERRGSFELLFQVMEYAPGKSLTLRLVQDTSGRVLKLLDRLEWKIELLPGFVRGTERAHTRSWRARVLSAFSERIVMNQLFYPDVMELAQFTQPSAPNPYPVYGQ